MIAIIDSGGANIASVKFALERLGKKTILTKDVSEIKSADRVLLPGVGAAPVAMKSLKEDNLIECIRHLKQPVLGICLGMQLLFNRSDEGDTEMLGVIKGHCLKFHPTKKRSVPHMGWNCLRPIIAHPLLKGLPDIAHVYFVHSYFLPVSNTTIAISDFGKDFTAIAAKGNFMGCQFHPEKSGYIGSLILKNFLELDHDTISSD